MIQKRIYQPLYLTCKKCNKKIEIAIPYRWINSDNKSDFYVKDRLEKQPELCDCEGIYDYFVKEYEKMGLEYNIKH